MAKFNPRATESVDAYKKQAENSERVPPVSGTYDVVNLKMGIQKIGQNATPKLRIITYVLKVVECDAKVKEQADKLVGRTFAQDIWWSTLFKDGDEAKGLNYNGLRVMSMAIAVGHDQEFDPLDLPKLAGIFCGGVAYRIKIEVTPNGKYHDVDVKETKHLSVDARKKYAEQIAQAKVMPRPEERLMDEQDFSKPRDGGDAPRGRRGKRDDGDTAQTQSSDPFRADDAQDNGGDLPF